MEVRGSDRLGRIHENTYHRHVPRNRIVQDSVGYAFHSIFSTGRPEEFSSASPI